MRISEIIKTGIEQSMSQEDLAKDIGISNQP